MHDFTDGPSLADRVSVEALDVDVFEASCGLGPAKNVFGGQLAGQAVMAAGSTVDASRPLRSLHAYFLRPPRPQIAIEYRVDRVRDGRSAAVRAVEAVQLGERVFTLLASFQTTDAVAHDQVGPPRVPAPEQVPVGLNAPVEVRPVLWSARSGEVATGQQLWMRCAEPLPEDPLVHAAAVTFVSDLSLGWSPWKALGVHRVIAPMYGASIDHTMWFHAPVRFDDWLLLEQRSQAVAGDRGLAVASIFDRSGRLVVTTAQEGLMRGVAATAAQARAKQETNGEQTDEVFLIA
jgi:acyl-CoA thioesterase-2